MLPAETAGSDYENFWNPVILTASGIAGVFTLWKLVGRSFWRSLMRLKELVAHSGELLRVLKTIEADFRPNGGSTIRDAISRIEQGVSKIDERQKALLTLSSDGIFETNPHGSCIYTNREYSEISGLLPNEAKDNGWIVALHPDDRGRVVNEWRSAVSDRRDFVSRFRFVHPDGTVSPVHVHAVSMKSAIGDLVGYIGVVQRDRPESVTVNN